MFYFMQSGNGGPVIDHDGNVTGMAFYCSPNPAVMSISIIMTCIDMWLKFRFVNHFHNLSTSSEVYS